MKHLLSLSLILAVAGCSSSRPDNSSTSSGGAAVESNRAVAPVQQQKSGGVAESDVIQPADAQWTIACMPVVKADHVGRAKAIKDQLVRSTGLKGFYVVHEDGASTIYYGFYRYISARQAPADDKKAKADGARAQADLHKLQSLRTKLGERLFPMARFSPLEPVDPPAPPEWDLRNVNRNKPEIDPTRAYYTLEIAVYKDSPQRKQAAVDSVRALREKMGVTDAYFYHGKTSSSVCVGTWPRSAVVEHVPDRGSSDDIPLVLPGGVPAQLAQGVTDSEGNTPRPVAITMEVVDPLLKDYMRRFDRRSVNGYDIKQTVRLKTGGTKEIFEPSQIIYMPDTTSVLNAPPSAPANTMTNLPGVYAPSGGGRLNSLDDQ